MTNKPIYLMLTPSYKYLFAFVAPSIFEAHQIAERIARERCFFSYVLVERIGHYLPSDQKW